MLIDCIVDFKDMDGMQFIEAIMNTIPVAEAGPSGVNLSVGVNGNANEGDSSDAAGAPSELLAKEQLRDKLENVTSRAVNVILFVPLETGVKK